MVFKKHILCLTHSFRNCMVSMNKECMPDTPFQEVTWFSCIRFVALLLILFFLIIECEQKGHKVTPGANSKVIVFEFLTNVLMNVSTAIIWDVRPCTSIHRCQRFGGTMSPCSEFANLLL